LIDSDVDGSNGAGTTALITLGPGECELNKFDAGLYQCVNIGELVWFDYNENDRWDPSENGINGLKVELYRFVDGGFVYYDYTYTGHKPGTPSDDGYFKFCAPPGKYYVKFFNPPSSLVPVVPNHGIIESIDSDVTGSFGSGTTDEFTVLCGQDKCDIGAGFYAMATIGDLVWMDNNNNGQRESNEPGVANVIVRAFDLTGTQLASATTDNNGNYMLDYLGKNTYFLKFDMPSGMSPTSPNAGNNNMIDSDVDNSNGPNTTPYYAVWPDTHTAGIDAGLIYAPTPAAPNDIVVDAHKEDNMNVFEWSLSNQDKISHYEIEKSINNDEVFELVGKKLVDDYLKSNADYTFNDYDVQQANIIHYRIKQIFENGDFVYSDIVSLERRTLISEKDNTVEIYPNPVVDELSIDLMVYQSVSEFSIDIFDAQGRIARKSLVMDLDVMEGEKKYRVSVSDLSKGIYTIKINMDGSQIVKKLIIIDQ